jgi:hypothetical protein
MHPVLDANVRSADARHDDHTALSSSQADWLYGPWHD